MFTDTQTELQEALTYSIPGGKLRGKSIQRCLSYDAQDLFKYKTPKVKKLIGVVAANAQDLDKRIPTALLDQIDDGRLSVDVIPLALLNYIQSFEAKRREADKVGKTMFGADVTNDNLTDYQRQNKLRERLATETQAGWLQRMQDLGELSKDITLTVHSQEALDDYPQLVLEDEIQERSWYFRIADGERRSRLGYKAVLTPARQMRGQDVQEQKFGKTIDEVSDDSRMRAFKKAIRHDPNNSRPDDTGTVPGAI